MSATPDYTIRESKRAKHVRLTMSAHDGLVVVIPKGFDRRQIPQILQTKQRWIERSTRQIEAKRRAHGLPATAEKLPTRIELRAIDRSWNVSYRTLPGSRTSVREGQDGLLVVTTPSEDAALRRTALRRWLLRKGRQHLEPAVRALADGRGFTVQRVRIGCQKGRWGSCSIRGTISLNAKLLFLPQEWVRYVLLHELCHTTELNHSARFWQLLEQHEPNAKAIRLKLRTSSWPLVPLWLARIHSSER